MTGPLIPLPWLVSVDCGHKFGLAGWPRAGQLITCLGDGCHCQRLIISAEFRGASCKDCGTSIPERDVHGSHFNLCLACRGARIPGRCPHKAGDRVQVHGYPGGRTELDRTGWRGTVEGWLGSDILTVWTDCGREWSGSYGAVDRERTPPHDRIVPCTCCPRPDAGKPVQEALFELAGT